MMEEKQRNAPEIRVGSIRLRSNVILAPMAGVTDLPFRILCEEMGAGLVCTEMVSAKAILYGNRNTEELLETWEGEGVTIPHFADRSTSVSDTCGSASVSDEPVSSGTSAGSGSISVSGASADAEAAEASGRCPVAVQLFGSDPEIMAEIAARLEPRIDIIDVNMGCPVPKIVRNGEGSDLMRNPDRAYAVLSAMVRAVHKPVSVKFRKGFDDTQVNAVEFARMAEDAGVSAVTVHGRTREQYYSGRADRDIIRRVKEAVQIPVFANGDVRTPADAQGMLCETGADGVAVARGVRGNPWLIRRILRYLSDGFCPDGPSAEEVREMVFRHAALMVRYKGEYIAVREMRKHISWYTAGFPNSSKLRDRVNRAETIEELLQCVSLLCSDCS